MAPATLRILGPLPIGERNIPSGATVNCSAIHPLSWVNVHADLKWLDAKIQIQIESVFACSYINDTKLLADAVVLW